MSKKKIIIDNDGGTDDFVAILYAILSKKFDIQGITLVAGNTDIGNVRDNVFKALEYAGVTPEEAKKIGIYIPEHINTDTISDGAQGNNGLGDVEYKKAVGYEINEEQTAEEKLIKIVQENPGEISIVATGPLTNIAHAIEMDPQFVKNVKELVIMGGDEGGGNITPYAEFNIYQDPESAKKVFEAGFDNITMIGFNITKNITIGPEIEEFLRIGSRDMGQFIYDITRVTADLDRRKNKTDGASMNDVVTLMYLLEREGMFTTKKANINVDISDNETRGQTLVSEGNKVNVVTKADAEAILREMLVELFPGRDDAINRLLNQRKKRLEVMIKLIEAFPEQQEKIMDIFNNGSHTKIVNAIKNTRVGRKRELPVKGDSSQGPTGAVNSCPEPTGEGIEK